MGAGRPVAAVIQERDAEGRGGGGGESPGSGYVLRVEPMGAAGGSHVGHGRQRRVQGDLGLS